MESQRTATPATTQESRAGFTLVVDLREVGFFRFDSIRSGIASTQPAVSESRREATTQPSVSSSSTALVVGATKQIVEVLSERGAETAKPKDWGWIYPAAAVVCLIAAAAAGYFLRSFALAGSLAACAGVLAALPWLGPWIAVLLGVCLLAGVVGLGYWLYTREASDWRRVLPGVAKLYREAKDEEALAALRAADKDLDAAFAAAKGKA